ncbi:unnamed protein product [Calicophoron daubneyi]|uniref:Threonylcarbamoyladenosine tRNA methylthiotransferase n=1 Tax=Calicophoron daubneyi TaxID=300641 RepID=A0AAV2THC3_CALDB
MDIEDLDKDTEITQRKDQGTVKARLKISKSHDAQQTHSPECDLPEKYRIFVQTWGCTHNTSDSEYMAGLLAKYGYHVTLGGSCPSDIVLMDSEMSDKPNSKSADNSYDCSPAGDSCKDCDSPAATKTVGRVSDEEAKNRADLWLLNSCTVKGPAEDHFRNAVTMGIKLGKKVVVAGCVPQSRPGADYLKGISEIGVQQIDRVVEVVEETLRGNTVRFLDKKWAASENGSLPKRRLGGAPLDLPKIRRNPLIEILAISTGCLNACTYCKTKHARGVLASYSIEELLDRAKQAFDEGVKELWLTSEDLGAYGRDLSRASSSLSCPSMVDRFPDCLTLSDLLAGLVPLIPPGCLLRLGMTNPPYILEQLKEVADVLSHPRVYSFIHVPVQSGSDAVLDVMQREYTVEEFCHVVEYLRAHVPPSPLPPDAPPNAVNGSGSLTVATDIICGFPNETEEDFQQTVDLISRVQFPVLYINQFFARPGTPAAKMTRKATTAEVKQRTRKLHDLFHSYRPYENRLGAVVRVLVTETSTDGRFWVGHTKAYEQVLVPKDPEVYGRIILVKITECDKFFMRSIILDTGPFDSLVFPSADRKSDEKPYILSTLAPLQRSVSHVKALATQSVKTEFYGEEPKQAATPTSDRRWIFGLALLFLLFYLVMKMCESWGYLSLLNGTVKT